MILNFIHLCANDPGQGLTSLFVQVGKFVQLMSTFLGGFIIAFVKGWLLTLVMLSSIPLLVASGAVMSLIISKMASVGQSAYAKASNVVEQTIGSVRTVSQDLLVYMFQYSVSVYSNYEILNLVPF